MSHHQTPGRALRHIRRRKAYTQEELAEKSGVHPITISRIESGRHKEPHPSTLRRLALAMEIAVEDLFLH